MNNPSTIPFLDLVTPHVELAEELTGVFQQALRTAGFIGGPMLESFETAFASFCGTSQCVGVGNGTDAVLFALLAVGVQPGDTVITVPNTFIATTEAISHAGATPEFVDIDERTYNIDPAALRQYLERDCTTDAAGRRISRRTGGPVTAIVPVHLYGQMADMDPILELGEEFGLIVIEDACQAHGAEYFSRRRRAWTRAGSMARIAAFSFYPGKNLGACGEAGAVTTSDAMLARKVRALRDHGQSQKYHHAIEGYNGRLDAIQAGILRVKLARLPQWTNQRRERAAEYHRMFVGMADVVAPFEPAWARAVYHLYVVRVPSRDRLIADLRAAGIATGIHYPIPLHLQEAYRARSYQPGDFPITERVAGEIVSLPMFPHLTVEEQARVAEEVARSLSG